MIQIQMFILNKFEWIFFLHFNLLCVSWSRDNIPIRFDTFSFSRATTAEIQMEIFFTRFPNYHDKFFLILFTQI